MENTVAIIEIGSNNTKTHIYQEDKIIYEANTTIEFKKNYTINKKIIKSDIDRLCTEIKKALTYTNQVFVFGCSIFRKISNDELEEINHLLEQKFGLTISVVSQEREAMLTAYGCYNDINYNGSICIFIGGGGSTELVIVNQKEVLEHKYFDFGVVDITNQFETLKEDIPTCSFDEVYAYIDSLIGDFDIQCDVLILAGGDHLYWYQNAKYKLCPNNLYCSDHQKYMIDIETSDRYDRDALSTSLDQIRKNSDNPLWFDGSRAMKVLTNVISHRVGAKYIVPTKINMEDGLKDKIIEELK